ncbi:carbamoyltransferase [Thermodesulfobacteriota bacterium]
MYILGVNCFMHNSAACLLCDGEIIAFAEEERFNRDKHTSEFPQNAIAFCLETASIEMNAVEHVGFFWKPWKGVTSRMLRILARSPRTILDQPNRYKVFSSMVRFRSQFRKRYGYRGKIHCIDHHTAHMAAAYYPSGFDKAAILVIDANGEIATTTYGRGRDNRVTALDRVKFPHSLGLLYLCVTEYLGFKENGGEGKVMGLSSYGTPRYIDDFREIVKLTGGGQYRVDMRNFDVHLSKRDYITKTFIERFGPRRPKEGPIEQRHRDIAASLQIMLEETVLELLDYLKRTTGERNLCLTGGVALNAVMNGRIEREAGFDKIFIQPSSNDVGTSLGAGLYIHHMFLGGSDRSLMHHVFFGPCFSNEQAEKALRAHGLDFERADDIEKQVADRIARGMVVGVLQGRMEVGPRALGNRSILADPRRAEMKDILNEKIKHREPFRPFAPVILQEHLEEFFPTRERSPYMLRVHPVRPEAARIIPAVVHVDGTCRIQTCNEKDNSSLYRIVKAFHAITGVPVVLNTSFNRRDEPIVCGPDEAIDCFLRSEMDTLVIENLIVDKERRSSGQ